MVEKSKNRLTLELILISAQRHFARFGYRKTSLADIARELGVAKGALYYYLPGGKWDLFSRVMDRAEEEVFTAMQAAATQAPNPIAALRALTTSKLEVLGRLRDLLGVRREVGEELAALGTPRDSDFSNRERLLIEDILQKGEKAGLFRPLRPLSSTSLAIQSVLHTLTVPLLFGDSGSDKTSPPILEALFDLLFHGLEARS